MEAAEDLHEDEAGLVVVTAAVVDVALEAAAVDHLEVVEDPQGVGEVIMPIMNLFGIEIEAEAP